MTIRTVDIAGHPLPGACFSVMLGLRGTEQSEPIEVDLAALRAGIVVTELCDADDGRLDGVITVGGPITSVELFLTEIRAASAATPGLEEAVEGLTLTIDLIESRSPNTQGGLRANRPMPQIVMPLTDIGHGARIRVVYGISDTPITLGPREDPPANDGTGVLE